MKKSILAILLALVMVASLLPATALADEDWTEVSSAEEMTDALAGGGNIKLTDSFSVYEEVNWVVTKSVVIDLNGKSITSTYNKSNYYLFMINGGSLTILDNSAGEEGKIEVNANNSRAIGIDGTGSKFTLESGTIAASYEALEFKSSAVNSVVNINGGTMTAQNGNKTIGVYGNGSVVNMTGGELIMTNGRNQCVYLNGIFNMSGGKIVSSGAGVYIRQNSELNVSGDAVIQSSFSQYGAIYVDGDEDAPAIVNITGGTVESTNNYCSAITSTFSSYGEISISGGNIKTANNKAVFSFKSTNNEVAISGGTFSSSVEKYLPEGSVLIQDGNGKVIVDETKTAVVAINGVGFTSMGAAIKAVGDGGTITVLQNITDAVGIAVDSGKNFTIDFAEHEYILVGPGAGSTKTETNGFQLLKDSTIVFKNGTIRIAENATDILRIIQNYANLTLENMDIYAENQVGGEDYALSFNNGTITFKGDTNIYTSDPEKTIAFDVRYWTPSYPNGVAVIFDDDFIGKIEGIILYDSIDAAKAKLEINGAGVFQNIETTEGSTSNPNISINGGYFATPVNSEYLSSAFKYQAFNGEYYSYHETFYDAQIAAGPNGTVEAITGPGRIVYTVIVKYGNGAADTVNTYVEGETIKLPAAPSKSGYAFLGWSDGTTTYDARATVTITKNTTFTAVWVRHPDTPYVPEPEQPEQPETPVFPFYDVPSSAWYYSAVKYVYENKLMDGVDTYVFAPNDTLTRAMVWTIIARMSGVDTTGGNTWYAKAQEWVITNGISDGENPTAAITREQLVTMLYRYAQIKGYDVSVGENTNILSYVDATSISEYAMSAFQWACGSGLTEGDENGALTPLATATRAQAAAMIMRFCQSVK